MKNPMKNFFGGSVTTEQREHETFALFGALRYWRANTAKERPEDTVTVDDGESSNANDNSRINIFPNSDGKNLRAFISSAGAGIRTYTYKSKSKITANRLPALTPTP